MDACAHLYQLYEHAARWSRKLGQPHALWEEKAKTVQRFIQKELWDPERGLVAYGTQMSFFSFPGGPPPANALRPPSR